jgi:hypothetical protein
MRRQKQKLLNAILLGREIFDVMTGTGKSGRARPGRRRVSRIAVAPLSRDRVALAPWLSLFTHWQRNHSAQFG